MSELDLYAIPDPMIGQQIRGYVIRKKLAEGGMGAVYIATHEKLENVRKVVKILLPEYARHPMLRERFEREALAVSRLRHRNIVTIDDYGQLPDGQLFLMMPFLEGRPLDAYLRDRGKFTEHRALHILVQVCSALQYMHDAGVVHRDIKPSNIFIVEEEDNPYRVFLIDLGIAKSLSERKGVTNAGAAMGTPAYMAVEQYENAESVTPLADLYSVGIVAWELVTGGLPWGMHSTHVLYTKQKQERPARPAGMSAEWYDILLAALSVHPDDRPQSMRALAVALASTVPAIPPHVPSGAEILSKLAKTFVQHAPPSAETVRNASNQERVAPILWPQRETRSPVDPSGALPPLNVHTSSSQREPPQAVLSGYPTPVLGPPPALGSPQTTLGASNGIAVAKPSATGRRLPLLYVVLLVSVGSIVAYTIVHRGETSGLHLTGVPMLGTGSASVSSANVAGVIDASAQTDAPPADAASADALLLDAPAVTHEAAKVHDEIKNAATPATGPAVTRPTNLTTPKDRRPASHSGSGGRFNPNAAGGE